VYSYSPLQSLFLLAHTPSTSSPKALPYWFKRYVFMNKDATLEPLYHFDVRPGTDEKLVK
jgi:hypothetical protein